MSYYNDLGKYEPDVLPDLYDEPQTCCECRSIIEDPNTNSWWLGESQNYGPFCTFTCAVNVQWEAYVNEEEGSLERTGPYYVSEYDPATGALKPEVPHRFAVLWQVEEAEEAPMPDDTVFFCTNCEERVVYNPGGICERCHNEGVYHCMLCATGLCGEGEVYCRECQKKES